jgi:hypothetical protein
VFATKLSALYIFDTQVAFSNKFETCCMGHMISLKMQNSSKSLTGHSGYSLMPQFLTKVSIIIRNLYQRASFDELPAGLLSEQKFIASSGRAVFIEAFPPSARNGYLFKLMVMS